MNTPIIAQDDSGAVSGSLDTDSRSPSPTPLGERATDHKKRKRGAYRDSPRPKGMDSSSSSGSCIEEAPPKKTPSRDRTPQGGSPVKNLGSVTLHSTPIRTGGDKSNTTLLGFDDSLAPVHSGSSPQIPLGQGTPTPYQSFEDVSAPGNLGDSLDLDATVVPSNTVALAEETTPPITVDTTNVSVGQLTKLCNLLSQVDSDKEKETACHRRP